MMQVTLQLNPEFASYLCCYFAGVAMVKAMEERAKLGGKNFIACYRLLDPEEKKLVRKIVRDFKRDPKAAMLGFSQEIEDAANDDLFTDFIKGLDDE